MELSMGVGTMTMTQYLVKAFTHQNKAHRKTEQLAMKLIVMMKFKLEELLFLELRTHNILSIKHYGMNKPLTIAISEKL